MIVDHQPEICRPALEVPEEYTGEMLHSNVSPRVCGEVLEHFVPETWNLRLNGAGEP